VGEEPVLVLGCDTGLKRFGWVVAEVRRERLVVRAMGVICTEKSDAKQRVLAASDTFRRAREVAAALEVSVRRATAVNGGRVRLACYEAISLPRDASASAKVGVGFGVFAGYVSRWEVPALEVSPQALKKALTGRGDASKVEVAVAVAQRLGLPLEARGRSQLACPWTPLMGERLERAAGDREHAWDACAALVACWDSDLMLALRGGAPR
jgi:Holliday junction resolvasome RuvABC endonuclease subunit